MVCAKTNIQLQTAGPEHHWPWHFSASVSLSPHITLLLLLLL